MPSAQIPGKGQHLMTQGTFDRDFYGAWLEGLESSMGLACGRVDATVFVSLVRVLLCLQFSHVLGVLGSCYVNAINFLLRSYQKTHPVHCLPFNYIYGFF